MAMWRRLGAAAGSATPAAPAPAPAPRGKRNRVLQAGRAVAVCSRPVRQGEGGARGPVAKAPRRKRRRTTRMTTTTFPQQPQNRRWSESSRSSVGSEFRVKAILPVLFFALFWTVKPGPALRGMYYLATWVLQFFFASHSEKMNLFARKEKCVKINRFNIKRIEHTGP
jgi:hypothetical protein